MVIPKTNPTKIYLNVLNMSYNFKMNGRIKLIITSPPIKKPTTATNDGSCKLDIPLMA